MLLTVYLADALYRQSNRVGLPQRVLARRPVQARHPAMQILGDAPLLAQSRVSMFFWPHQAVRDRKSDLPRRLSADSTNEFLCSKPDAERLVDEVFIIVDQARRQ